MSAVDCYLDGGSPVRCFGGKWLLIATILSTFFKAWSDCKPETKYKTTYCLKNLTELPVWYLGLRYESSIQVLGGFFQEKPIEFENGILLTLFWIVEKYRKDQKHFHFFNRYLNKLRLFVFAESGGLFSTTKNLKEIGWETVFWAKKNQRMFKSFKRKVTSL